jgi:hypothetical protein
MLFKFISFIMIALILLFVSIKLLKKRFDSFEIFIYFLFTSYWCQQFFYFISSPYNRLRVVEEHLPFWTARIQFGIISPLFLLGVLYFFRGNHNLSKKIMICFVWVVSEVLIRKFLLLIGILESNSKDWYPDVALVVNMVVISSSIYIIEIFYSILLKEKMINK